MLFSPLKFGEKLSNGAPGAPKSRMEQTGQMHSFTNKVAPYNQRGATADDPYRRMYENAQRMNKESDDWYAGEGYEGNGTRGGRGDFKGGEDSSNFGERVGVGGAARPPRSSSAYGAHTFADRRDVSGLQAAGVGTGGAAHRGLRSGGGGAGGGGGGLATLEGRGMAALGGGIPVRGNQGRKSEWDRPSAAFGQQRRAQSAGGRSDVSSIPFSNPLDTSGPVNVRGMGPNKGQSQQQWGGRTPSEASFGIGGGGGPIDTLFIDEDEDMVPVRDLAAFDPIALPKDLRLNGGTAADGGRPQQQQRGGAANATVGAAGGLTSAAIARLKTEEANAYREEEEERGRPAGGSSGPNPNTNNNRGANGGIDSAGGAPLSSRGMELRGIGSASFQGGRHVPTAAQQQQRLQQPFATNTNPNLSSTAAYADPTTSAEGLGGVNVRPLITRRGPNANPNPMYRTTAGEAFAAPAAGGRGAMSAAGATANNARGANGMANGMLAYNEQWVPRIGGAAEGGQRGPTTTAVGTGRALPGPAGHPSEGGGRRNAVDVDTVVQRVGGPPPTSIGAAALEAIRREKRYRAKLAEMVAELDEACRDVGGRLGYGHSNANRGGAFPRPNPRDALTEGIPLITAGGPISRHAALLERLDNIQQQIRARVISRAGPASTSEQRARALQTLLEQHAGLGAEASPQQQQQQRNLGVVPGQPLTTAQRQQQQQGAYGGHVYGQQQQQNASSAQQAHGAGAELTADQLVAALRQGFAIPITADEADAFIDHCDVDEKGTVSAKEMAEGIMAGGWEGGQGTPSSGRSSAYAPSTTGSGQNQNSQIESILALGPKSSHAPYYKASDVFAYLRRRRMGALADPAVRRVILSIKARLLERSIANNAHLGPESLASVGSMRAFLVAILARFPTTLAVASPEAYYDRLRRHEQATERALAAAEEENRAMRGIGVGGHQQQRRTSSAAYGNASGYNPITGAGGFSPFYGGAEAAHNTVYGASPLRHGRPQHQPRGNATTNPITSAANANGYGNTPHYPAGAMGMAGVLPLGMGGTQAQAQAAARQRAAAAQPPPLPPDLLEQRVISPPDLLNGLQTLGVRGITMKEIETLLTAANAPNGIAPRAFVALLRGPLPRRRRRIIHEVFTSIDANKDGVLSVDEVMGSYDASNHPAVIVGEATAEEVKRSFMAMWLKDANGDGVIDWSEFLNTYKDVSDEIENDDYFELVLRNCWHLSGGYTAAATNTTCRRVLVTFYDGSQRVEEIKNDMGIRASDKATMIRRLEQQGCRGIVSVELYG